MQALEIMAKKVVNFFSWGGPPLKSAAVAASAGQIGTLKPSRLLSQPPGIAVVAAVMAAVMAAVITAVITAVIAAVITAVITAATCGWCLIELP